MNQRKLIWEPEKKNFFKKWPLESTAGIKPKANQKGKKKEKEPVEQKGIKNALKGNRKTVERRNQKSINQSIKIIDWKQKPQRRLFMRRCHCSCWPSSFRFIIFYYFPRLPTISIIVFFFVSFLSIFIWLLPTASNSFQQVGCYNGFHRCLPSFLLGFTGFSRFLTYLYWVWLGSTWFYLVFTVFLGFTGFNCVFPDYLLSFTGFYRD